MKRIFHISVLLAFSGICVYSCRGQVKVGADILVAQYLDILQGKRVGLITNHSGRLSSGEYLVDVLTAKGIKVVALFGPEHGVRGDEAAGEAIHDTVDPGTGIPVFSLYGKTNRPSPEMLRDVDILVYDIQDVGARFYTYLSTMALCMESAARKGIPFVILDRPDPLGGVLIDGPVLEDSLRSFVGMFPIPVVYGLTCGELGRMINGECWLNDSVKADLTVIPLEGWRRSMKWAHTGLQWPRPSPNIPTDTTAEVYPGLCLLEATNVSEGRGTNRPFQTVGAPFVNGEALASSLDSLRLPGVTFRPVDFIPASSKYKGELCHGVFIDVTSADSLKPTTMGLSIVSQLWKLYRENLVFSERGFRRLAGVGGLVQDIKGGVPPRQMEERWKGSVDEFRILASRYRLYANE